MSSRSNSVSDLGQLFMVGLPDTELDDSTLGLIKNYCINNFILFKRNVIDPSQLRALCKALRNACHAQGLAKPLVAIDQEGGTVARLPPPFTQFLDARVIAESDAPEEGLRSYAETCVRELRDVGINMNLAPVLDVCPTGQGYFMEQRSLGDDPEEAARLGNIVIEEMQRGKLAACAKHFPGLGAATLDPHDLLPTVALDPETLRARDLIPFKRAIKSNVAAIMTSHTIYSNIDPDRPATLSGKILSDLLRDELGYQGLVITDDLEMGAIENEWSVAEASVKAFGAGADLLLICHDHGKVVDTYKEMEAAASKGVFDSDRIQSSVQRVVEVQNRFAMD